MKTMLFKRGARIEGPSGVAYELTQDIESSATPESCMDISGVRIPTAALKPVGGALDLSQVNLAEHVNGAPDWFWDFVSRAEFSCWSVVSSHQWYLDRPNRPCNTWDGSIA